MRMGKSRRLPRYTRNPPGGCFRIMKGSRAMKIERTSYTPHPEGWFLFYLGEPEEVEATWNNETKKRLCWPCISATVKGDEGEGLQVNLFTGVRVSDHPADKHRSLVE